MNPSELFLVRAPIKGANPSLKEVSLAVERSQLAGRLWRGVAADGTEFCFEGEAPLRHGDVVRVTATSRTVVRQSPERLLEIPLDLEPNAASWMGWVVGSLQVPIEVRSTRVLAPDETPVREALDRIAVHYQAVLEVFHPHRFVGGWSEHGQASASPFAEGQSLGVGTG